jgi:hypothetical protein
MSNPKILYDNALDDGTPAASTTATGFDVLNLRDWRPYTRWKPTAIPATVTVDRGSAQACDYGLLWGHNLYTTGCTAELRGSTDNFSASDVLVDSITPTSDDPILLQFGAVSYRYWRWRFTTGTAPTIAIAAMGTALEMPVGLDFGFDPVGRMPMGAVNTSESGHPLGTVTRFEEWSETLTFDFVTWAWLRATWLPAWEAHLRDKPFVLAWEPTSYDTELRLVTRKGGFKAPHQPGSYGKLSFDVVGVAS